MEGGERVGREAAEREREGQQLEMEFPERKEVTGSPPPPPRKASEIYLLAPRSEVSPIKCAVLTADSLTLESAVRMTHFCMPCMRICRSNGRFSNVTFYRRDLGSQTRWDILYSLCILSLLASRLELSERDRRLSSSWGQLYKNRSSRKTDSQ